MPLFREQPELLEPFRRGEPRALEVVYFAYVERVELILRRGFQIQREQKRVTGASPSDVRDLLQEVFLRAFDERARRAFDGVREYGPYLATIARNVLADWGRKRGQTLLLDEIPAHLEPSTVEPDALEEEDPRVLRIVEEYISGLTPELRGVHRERYELAHSQAEAARALELSRQQLRTLEGHLRKGLARALLRAELGASLKNQPVSAPARIDSGSAREARKQ